MHFLWLGLARRKEQEGGERKQHNQDSRLLFHSLGQKGGFSVQVVYAIMAAAASIMVGQRWDICLGQDPGRKKKNGGFSSLCSLTLKRWLLLGLFPSVAAELFWDLTFSPSRSWGIWEQRNSQRTHCHIHLSESLPSLQLPLSVFLFRLLWWLHYESCPGFLAVITGRHSGVSLLHWTRSRSLLDSWTGKELETLFSYENMRSKTTGLARTFQIQLESLSTLGLIESSVSSTWR